MRLANKAAALVTAILVTAAPISAQALTTPKRIARASGYIANAQVTDGSIPSYSTFGSTADAVVAMVAAGRGPVTVRKALRFLRREIEGGAIDAAPDYDQVGLMSKAILAAVAGGKDPHSFGGRDLVQDILDTEQGDGRYGAASGSFNQALAIIALKAAKRKPSARSLRWLADAQCADGGWAYDGPPKPNDDSHCTDTIDPPSDYFPSDTNTTSLAVQALEASGGPAPITDPFKFFRTVRDGGAGWGYAIGYITDTNSTGMVLQAYAAAGKRNPDGSMGALKGLQDTACGGFDYSHDSWVTGPDTASTLGGILGLLRKPLPVRPAELVEPPAVPDCA